MTGWGVERKPRPARRPSVVSSTGPALMPPHSQGAERRRGNRPGPRWGLRALVVGGIAGAAWLLSGAAAHAAEHEPVTGGLLGAATQATGHDGGSASLLGAVMHGAQADAPRLGRVLKTAVKPLESGGHHTGLGTVTTIPKRLVDTVGEVAHGTKDAVPALSGVDRVIRDITAPVRLTGDAVSARPFVPVTVPATDLPHYAADPEPVASHQDRPEPDAGATKPDVARTAVPQGPSSVDVAMDEQKSAPVLIRDLVRHPVGAVSALETVRETPDGDGTAPLRVDLGAVNGFPASGAGTATDGGPSAAVLPSAVADSTTACRRLPIATDVEVRRHDAEAPTVSPD